MWTRRTLASSAAEYDAVVEITASVINQVLARQAPISLPTVRLPARNVVAQSPTTLFTGGATNQLNVSLGSSAQLSLAPVRQNSLGYLGSAVHLIGRDVLVRLTIQNESMAPVMLVATPILGGVTRPASSPFMLTPGADGMIEVLIVNVPTASHQIQIRVFDLSQVAEILLEGTLVIPAPGAVQIGQPGLAPFPTISVPGLNTRVSRSITVEATPRAFVVDLDASVGGTVQLECIVSCSIDTIESQTTFTDWPRAIDDQGRLTSLPVDVQYSTSQRSTEARLRLVAQLTMQVDQSTKVVEANIDLATATIVFTATDPDVRAVGIELEHQFRNALAEHALRRTTGSRVNLSPRLSLVGALRQGETVNELSFQQITAQVLAPASAGGRPVLMLALGLAGNTRPKGTPDNFVGAADFGVVINAAVVQASAAFRWRVNDYPRVLLGRPVEDALDEVEVLVYPQMRQTSIVDNNGSPVAGLRAAGPRTYGTSTGIFTFLMNDPDATVKNHSEDHVLLGGQGDFEIANVVRKDNHQSLGEDARKAYEAPAALKGVLFQWSFSMSSVTQPAPVADPNVETFLQSVRTGVTRHLSRPFAAPHTVTLLSRDVNGFEGLMLSLGRITL